MMINIRMTIITYYNQLKHNDVLKIQFSFIQDILDWDFRNRGAFLGRHYLHYLLLGLIQEFQLPFPIQRLKTRLKV